MVIWTEALQERDVNLAKGVSVCQRAQLVLQDSSLAQYLPNTHLIFLPKAQHQCVNMA